MAVQDRIVDAGCKTGAPAAEDSGQEADEREAICRDERGHLRGSPRRHVKDVDTALAKPVLIPDRDALKAALELRSVDWRNVLRSQHVSQARLVLQHLIDLPMGFAA